MQTLITQPSALSLPLQRPASRPQSRRAFTVRCASGKNEGCGRRDTLVQGGQALVAVLLSSSVMPGAAQAGGPVLGFKKDMNKPRRLKVPESEYKDLPNGLKYYDVKIGDGKVAKKGDRVAVHYEVRWRGVTFMTSRQGMGVTGGSPIGFDIGTDEQYGTLPGLDQGVRGMHVGGYRKLLVPPELAYGDKGVGEIPGGATLEFDVELLSIKTSPFGSRVKIVEG